MSDYTVYPDVGWNGSYERVNIFDDNQSIMLRDLRTHYNIWKYVKDNFLGEYFPIFKRQFYATYDYFFINYDSPEEFASRLAGRLENLEDEYLFRLNTLNLIKNPLVNRIFQETQYSLKSQRTKSFNKNNAIADNVNVGQRVNLGVGGTTTQEAMNAAEQGANDTHNQMGHQQQSLVQQISNSAEQSAHDEHTQTASQEETMADLSQTDHTLNRYTDSPEQGDMTSQVMPIGWTGTGGAIGTAAKNDHYPKAEAYVPLPYNDGYLSHSDLTNIAHDEHHTTGEESLSDTQTQQRDAKIAGTEMANTGTEAARTDTQIQNRSSRTNAMERANTQSETMRANEQSVQRNQNQSYDDNETTGIMAADTESVHEITGLEGVLVGDVWTKIQTEYAPLKNAIGDLVSDCRPCFLIIA